MSSTYVDIDGLLVDAASGERWGVLFEGGRGHWVRAAVLRRSLPHLAPADAFASFAVSFLIRRHHDSDVIYPEHPRDPAPSSCLIPPWLLGGRGGWNGVGVNRRLADGVYGSFVVQGTGQGVDLMLAGRLPRGRYKNHVGRGFVELVDAEVQKQVERGILVDISFLDDADAPVPNPFASIANNPLRAIMKADGKRVRVLVDCSNVGRGVDGDTWRRLQDAWRPPVGRTRRERRPMGRDKQYRGINGQTDISRLPCPMARPLDVAAAVWRLQERYPECDIHIMVRDLDGAFDQMPVRVDDWPALKVEWAERTFLRIRGPMGDKAIPANQCMFSTALAEHVSREFDEVEAEAYVDDFAVMVAVRKEGVVDGPGLDPQVVDDFLTAAAADVGSPISVKKAEEAGPASPTAVWCGVEFDTVQKTMRVSEVHLERARAEVVELMQCERHSVQRLREIAGHLEFVASVYPLARSYTHRLWCAANQGVSGHTRVRLSKAAAADVVFWFAFLSDLGPVQPMPRPERLSDLVVLGDASLKGFGFWTPRGRRGWRGTWPQHFPWQSGDMAVLELLTVLAALRTLEPEIRGKSVTVWTDNEAVYKCLKRMRGRKTRMRWLMRVVALFCSASQVTIHPHWLPTNANRTADVLSRRTSSIEVMNETTLSSVSSVTAPGEVGNTMALTARLFRRQRAQKRRPTTSHRQHATST